MNQPLAIGTICEVSNNKAGLSNESFVVELYREDGYMLMRNKHDSKMTMTIHPEHARRIAENGTDSGIKVLQVNGLQDVIVRATEQKIEMPVLNVVEPVITSVTPEQYELYMMDVQRAGLSKKDRARSIRMAHPNATRKQLIELFVDLLGMTAAGASTYASYKD